MNGRRVELGLRSETIRRANLSAIVRELHVSGPLSRSELGVRTGLTRSAIRVLIGELTGAGLVSERSGPSLGTPGRPSVLVNLRDDRAVVLALEISVDSLAAAIVGLGGSVHRLERRYRSREAFPVEKTIEDLQALLRAVELDAYLDVLVGVGVGVAGIVRRQDGFVPMAPNLGWRDVPIAQLIASAVGHGADVWVANEADLAALAEHRRGAARGFDDVLFVSGEVGVGGGLIIGGRPMTGSTGYGGEVGHLPLNPAGSKCGCGSTGCWETEAGERPLLARAGYPADSGRDGVEAVLRDAAAGGAAALAAMDHVGEWLGRGVAGLVNVLNPRQVVVGGLFGRIYPYIRNRMDWAYANLALPASRDVASIVPGSLGINAPVLGAAELAFEALLEDPAALAENGIKYEWRVVA